MQERPDDPEKGDEEFDEDGFVVAGDQFLRDHMDLENVIYQALKGDEEIDRKTRDAAIHYLGGLRFTVCALMDLLKSQGKGPGEIILEMAKRQQGNNQPQA